MWEEALKGRGMQTSYVAENKNLFSVNVLQVSKVQMVRECC